MPDCKHEATRGVQGSTGQRADRAHTQKVIFTEQCGKCGAIRVDKQIGLEKTPEAFIEKLTEVFREVRRVLRDDGTCFINIGDSYSNDTKWGGRSGGKNSTSLLGGYQGQRVRRGRAQRATACDISGKELEDYPESDCLCGSLCGVCRAAYRLGKSHSGHQPVPTLRTSPFGSIHAHKESPSDHPPTSDSTGPEVRTGDANPNLGQVSARANERFLASLASTNRESFSLPLDLSRSVASTLAAECQLCGRSLLDSDQESFRKRDGIFEIPNRTEDNASPSAAPESRIQCTAACCLLYAPCNLGRHIKPISSNLKPKDLVGIPWMLAFALRADGWYLRSEIIWSKKNPMPESVRDRPTKAHEQIFLFSKSPKYWYDCDAIKETGSADTHSRYARGRSDEHKWADGGPGGQSIAKSFEHMATRHLPGNKTHKGTTAYENGDERHRTKAGLVEYATKVRERAAGVNPKCAEPGSGIKQNSSFSAAVKDIVEFRNKRSVWSMSSMPTPEAHFATFPLELPETCILAGCPADGLVLDPFAGAGTTGLAALKHGRNFLGIELNPAYVAIAESRLNQKMPLFA